MSLTHEQILAHIEIIREAAFGWKEFQLQLLNEDRATVVPLVLEALEMDEKRSKGFLFRFETMLRLTQLLELLDDARSLRFYLRLAPLFTIKYFYDGLSVVEQRATTQDIQVLVEMLGRSTRHRVRIAETLVRMAERDPKPELKAALPLLAYNLTTPFEFIGLRKRLRAVFAEGTFPIPTTPSPTANSLPLPTRSNLE